MVGAMNRYNSRRKALRKRRIDSEVFWHPSGYGWSSTMYNNLHQYSKNKIHCSCPMCSAKTRNKGSSKQKGMAPSINYKISDQRNIDRLTYAE